MTDPAPGERLFVPDPPATACQRCRQTLSEDGRRSLLVRFRVPPSGVALIREGELLGPFCEGCDSFLDAAIHGRPCWSRGVGEHVEALESETVNG